MFSMTGCVTDSSATHDGNMNWYSNPTPEADANSALEHNDFRLMGLSLRGTVLPGIDPAKMHQYELKCGVILMSGVSDTVRGKNQLKKMQQAHDYAAKYNAVIKQRCVP